MGRLENPTRYMLRKILSSSKLRKFETNKIKICRIITLVRINKKRVMKIEYVPRANRRRGRERERKEGEREEEEGRKICKNKEKEVRRKRKKGRGGRRGQ